MESAANDEQRGYRPQQRSCYLSVFCEPKQDETERYLFDKIALRPDAPQQCRIVAHADLRPHLHAKQADREAQGNERIAASAATIEVIGSM